jgi:hypothetical protein
MVENGISPDVSDYDLRTSIHIAASDGMLLSVAFLVEKCNCEINPVDRWDKTPMQVWGGSSTARRSFASLH